MLASVGTGLLLSWDGEQSMRGERLHGVSMWAGLSCTEEPSPELLYIQLWCPQHRTPELL